MSTVWLGPLKFSAIALALAIFSLTATAASAATASWDPNSEPDLAGYKLSYGTQPGVHTVVIDVGKVTTYTFNPAPGQRYYVVVQAYNTAGVLSEKSAEAVLDVAGQALVSNQPPTLTQPANQTTVVNIGVMLPLSVSDPEGAALTLTATGLPPGLSVNSALKAIAGTPNSVGVYQTSVKVSDGTLSVTRSFSWTIVDPAQAPTSPVPPADSDNKAPVLAFIADQETGLNATVSLPLVASDPEGDQLEFTAIGLPSGLSINRTTGLISGTTRSHGSSQVTIIVSDGSLTANRRFKWSIKPSSGKKAVDEASASRAGEGGEDGPANQDFVGVEGDFDGDGRADLATYRLSSSEWRIWTSGSNFATPTVMVWGEAGDRPMPADYNGDRVTDFAIYRPSTGTWHLSLSGSQSSLSIHWGSPEDTPVALDHDGDGKADLAVIRNGRFEILLSSANYLKSVQVQ